MKKDFGELLYQEMQKNPNIWCLTGDLGFGVLNKIRDDFPERFLNVGAAEQSLLDIGCGLALEGKIPFCYTISPFLYRGWETIRTYINHERLNVKLVGAGVGNEYAIHDGFSHDATDIPEIFRTMKNIIKYFPNTRQELQNALSETLAVIKPALILVHK